MSGTDAIRPGVTAAEDDDVLAFRGDLIRDGIACSRPVLLHQVIHGEVHAQQVTARDGQITRNQGSRRDHDRVVSRLEVAPADVLPDLDSSPEARALRLHLREARLDLLLLHFEIRDAVAQKSANAIVALIDGDGVPGARQLLRRGEAGRPGPDDGNSLARQTLRRMRGHPSVLERLVDDRDLDLLDGHRRLIDAEHTARLARRRAETTGELGKIVRGVKALDGLTAFVAPGEVVPLRDQVAERAAVVAERDAAVHAPTGLAAQLLRILRLVDLFPVHDAHRDGPALGQFALLRLQEPFGVSHPSPP